MQTNGFHTAANSQRTRLIECGMDVQILAGERIAADKPEAEVLAELAKLTYGISGFVGEAVRKRVNWLIKHDERENKQHGDLYSAGREICQRWETVEPALAAPARREMAERDL